MRMMPGLLALLFMAAAAPAWAGDSVPRATDGGAACKLPAPPSAKESFRHRRSRIVRRVGASGHVAPDVLAVAGRAFVVSGKFAYGGASKDLEDERVKVFAGDCAGWQLLGEAITDDEGWARLESTGLAAGVHSLALVVVGDGTRAEATLTVVPVGTRIAVFDVDGTLTTSDAELFRDVGRDLVRPIVSGKKIPAARPGGAALTHVEAARGHAIVYLTGRPYLLAGRTREWLARIGAAPGPLYVAPTLEDALPSRAGVAEFKLAVLRALQADGCVIDVAYGNATTDIDAYLGAGLRTDQIFIAGKHGGERGTNSVGASWEERVRQRRAAP